MAQTVLKETQMDLKKLKNQLILEEALRLRPYRDSKGKLTIGVGRNLDDRGISLTTALQMLDEDLREVSADLAKFSWWDKLDDTRQRVLADMRFNLGQTKFLGFTKMLQAVSEGKFPEAADEMLDSQWALEVKSRAIKLARMMRTGQDA